MEVPTKIANVTLLRISMTAELCLQGMKALKRINGRT